MPGDKDEDDDEVTIVSESLRPSRAVSAKARPAARGSVETLRCSSAGALRAAERGHKALQQQTLRDPKYNSYTKTTTTRTKTSCTLQQRGL
ncbi:unnamed protein product [Polarella glacialis]|uniref:Uncharacterized protein n=1 Tax=Polarella glacialis TaxID=89957 RepID=A0A813HR33_POLGL|nr:unnamed protein product [Polarella glacialis]